MKKLYMMAAVSAVTGVLLVAGLAGTALVWHPEGKIKKEVQNVTAGGALADANDEATAVDVKPGDTLKYVVTIRNDGEPHQQGWNDLHDVVITDQLPDGLELVGAMPAMTIERLRAGESKTFEFTVKVIKQQDGSIKNTACFVGYDGEEERNRKDGCDDAVVKVKKPKQEILESATTLPVTGPANVVGIFAGVSGLGYVAHRVISRKR